MAKWMSGIFWLVVFIIADQASACSQPEGWKALPVEDRAAKSQWIAYGTVISEQMPTLPGGNASTDQQYTVRFQPMCWLKKNGSRDAPDASDDDAPRTGDASGGESTEGNGPMRSRTGSYEVDFRNLTILEVRIDCVKNELQKGTDYILFLMKQPRVNDTFAVQDVNTESGALANPGDEHFAAIYRRLNAGKRGDSQCAEGVEIVCFAGDDDSDKSQCSGGAALGAAVLSLVVAALLAFIGY